MSLQIGSAGPSHSLPPGWYIEDPRESILLGNLPINGLDEWDVAKLGWFKSRSISEDHIDATGQQIIRQAFKAQVEDCGQNSIKYQVALILLLLLLQQGKRIAFLFPQFFRGFLDHNQLEGSRRVEEMFSFVKSVSIWRRHVEVTHRESPLLVMTMQHRSKASEVA